MKKTAFCQRSFLLMLIILLPLCLWGCGTKAMVTIQDTDVETEIEVTLPATVEQILKEAQIELREGDRVSPALEEKLRESAAITIERQHQILLNVDGVERSVTMVGGTVADLLAQEGIVLSENQQMEPERTTVLKEGMKVIIYSLAHVTVEADGQTYEGDYTADTTVGDVLKAQGIQLGEFDLVSAKTDTLVSAEMVIVINRVTFETEIQKETVPFATEYEEDDSLDEGVEETVVEGQDGEKELEYRLTMLDGREISRELVRTTITQEPVNEMIRIGTYVAPQPSGDSGSGGSGGSTGPYEVERIAYPNCDDPNHGYYEIHYSDGTVEYEEY